MAEDKPNQDVCESVRFAIRYTHAVQPNAGNVAMGRTHSINARG